MVCRYLLSDWGVWPGLLILRAGILDAEVNWKCQAGTFARAPKAIPISLTEETNEMKRTWIAIAGTCALALAMSTSSLAQTAPAPAPKPNQMKGQGSEEHPHIQNAIKALENAKHQLETASHDFAGHREKALDHVEQALQECREALKADKK